MKNKLNKLFFVREYIKGTWAVHRMMYCVVTLRFWRFKYSYLRNIGYEVIIKSSKTEALKLALNEKENYVAALKYIKYS